MLTRRTMTIVLICVGALIGGAAAQAHDRGFWGGEAQSSGSVDSGMAAASSPLPILPRGNYSLEDARRFSRFSLYYAGASTLGHSLTAVHRIDAKPYPGERVRRDDVTFLYGGCQPVSGTCVPPVQIQAWNSCERYEGLYDILPDEKIRIRGASAAFYEDYTRLEIQSGRTTIVIFGDHRHNRGGLIEVADRLQSVDGMVSPGENLPPPAPGARTGLLACQTG